MLRYVLPFLAYVLISPFLNLFFKDIYLNYTSKTLITGLLLLYYFKQYKEIKFKFDFLAVVLGVVIFIVWVGLEGMYPALGSSLFNPYNAASSLVVPVLLIKLIGAILVAPLAEELFTRSFLIRFFIEPNKWEKIKIGKYTLFSFIVTVLFFGFSHNRWLPGIITGIFLNLLLYKRKQISSCIIAHGVANLCLAVYVLATGNWGFW